MAVAETVLREAGQDFIRDIVRADLESGRRKTIVTRIPPEPMYPSLDAISFIDGGLSSARCVRRMASTRRRSDLG